MNSKRASEGLVIAHLRCVAGVLTNMPLSQMAAQFRILIEDLQLVAQPNLWTNPGDRTRIKTTIEACVWGSLDALGVPRIELPAEYLASWIAILVAPVNRMTACAFFDRPRVASDLAQDPNAYKTYEGVTPARLFAMVYIAASHEHKLTKALEQHVASALFRAVDTLDEIDTEEIE